MSSLLHFRVLIVASALIYSGILNRANGSIATENSLTGNPKSEWDVSGIGDTSIQGFATDISVNRGQTISFKVSTTAAAYRIDIYRLGYYGGLGARKVATINPSVSLPQTQPAFVRDAATGLVDCGNWAVSASWSVPSTATSGVYIARLVRTDTGGASHIVFIVRDDAGGSDILFQTSDTTWQAYNNYGGASLYGGNGPGAAPAAGRSYKVSYNRPFNNRAVSGTGALEGFLFAGDYPMIRWLEANGYNVSYASGLDTDRQGSAALLSHKIFLSVAHDEYWSGQQRANVEAARAAGVQLGFFSGNEMFWKTRWENSIDGTNTPYRTLVCYKETNANAKIDPSSVWTGTWRDARFSPPADGGRPENAVSGQLSAVDDNRYDPILISSSQGKARFWRNTGIDTLADGQTAQLPAGVLGYEWDQVSDNGFSPPGLMRLSTTTVSVQDYLQDYGTNWVPGVATHNLTLYRHSSGALVFAAGTVRWAWGLDATHDLSGPAADPRMQQATVNVLADMGVQPLTLRSGLVPATQSTDTIPPSSLILTPQSGATVQLGVPVTIIGTATDAGGGRPVAVEFSIDGGTTWHPANGAANWSATWMSVALGPMTIMSRAIDDSGLIESPGPGVTVSVAQSSLTYKLWSSNTTPSIIDQPDPTPYELGVRFLADQNGWITALRFYKCSNNTGIHVGHLWTSNGTLLATAPFTGETASDWQQAPLATPVSISAGVSYVASYSENSGHFSRDISYFASKAQDQPPLHAPVSGVAGGNGVYNVGTNAFPANSYSATNYWVDVVYSPSSPSGYTLWTSNTTPSIIDQPDPTPYELGVRIQADRDGWITALRFYKCANNTGVHVGHLWANNGALLAAATFTGETASGWQQAQLATAVPISAGVSYLATYSESSGHYSRDISYFATKGQDQPPLHAPVSGVAGANGVYNVGTNAFPSNSSNANNYWVDVVYSPSGYTMWPPSTTPAIVDQPDPTPYELGVRFLADQNGWIKALRFYKCASNTGVHVAHLWTSSGTLLATANFTAETASGWQEAQLATPVSISAGVSYVVSYSESSGHYSRDLSYFSGKGQDRSPLHAPASGVAGGNGVYNVGTNAFPANSYSATNYWVDVVFSPSGS